MYTHTLIKQMSWSVKCFELTHLSCTAAAGAGTENMICFSTFSHILVSVSSPHGQTRSRPPSPCLHLVLRCTLSSSWIQVSHLSSLSTQTENKGGTFFMKFCSECFNRLVIVQENPQNKNLPKEMSNEARAEKLFLICIKEPVAETKTLSIQQNYSWCLLKRLCMCVFEPRQAD